MVAYFPWLGRFEVAVELGDRVNDVLGGQAEVELCDGIQDALAEASGHRERRLVWRRHGTVSESMEERDDAIDDVSDAARQVLVRSLDEPLQGEVGVDGRIDVEGEPPAQRVTSVGRCQ